MDAAARAPTAFVQIPTRFRGLIRFDAQDIPAGPLHSHRADSGNPAFIGLDAAAPLFFRIVDAVEAEHPSLREPVRPMPANVKSVEICLASGELPNQWCPQKGKTWFIPGKSPIRVSDVHRPVMIDDATGRAACPPYAGKHVHREIFEFWSSDLQQVFIDAGIPRRKPPLSADCSDAGAPDGAAPRIVSPRRGSAHVLRLGQSDRGSIALNAAADGDTRTLYWFVDDAYVGLSAPDQPLYWRPAAAGEYRVRVVDDHGRSDERPLPVTLMQ